VLLVSERLAHDTKLRSDRPGRGYPEPVRFHCSLEVSAGWVVLSLGEATIQPPSNLLIPRTPPTDLWRLACKICSRKRKAWLSVMRIEGLRAVDGRPRPSTRRSKSGAIGIVIASRLEKTHSRPFLIAVYSGSTRWTIGPRELAKPSWLLLLSLGKLQRALRRGAVEAAG